MIMGWIGFVAAQFDDPFKVTIFLDQSKRSLPILSVSFGVPDGNYLYKNIISVKASPGISIIPHDIPVGYKKYDDLSEKEIYVYKHDAVQKYAVNGNIKDSSYVIVEYQGCNSGLCFAPESKTFNLISGKETKLKDTGDLSEGNVETEVAIGWRSIADKFEVIGSMSGYRKSDEFVRFLDGTDIVEGHTDTPANGEFGNKGIVLTILFILLGGMLLNLTPCVLPMIPINIAIIGAGVQSGSRAKGFLLGGVYGAGIAVVYGVLGLVVILTGAKFGSLNSLPIFNFGIALLFVILSLSMFGLFSIDLTRFQGKLGNSPKKSGGLLPAFFMGGVAALLAGACVAPVVISVLLLATNLYQGGNISALLLPFVLGLGMALPWPFAGGGLSFLPKPGAWMERIKQVFGVIIMLAAIYYAVAGIHLIQNKKHKDDFADMLQTAQKDGLPVLIDFWASWCKNCAKMEKSTFQDEEVIQKMKNFHFIKYQAEDVNDPETKAILDYYKVIGLPTYIKLQSKE